MAAVDPRTVDPDESGMRLDRWFRDHFPDLGFGHLQKLIRSGQVRIDGGRAKTNTRLEPGQVVRIPPLDVGRGGKDSVPAVTGPSTSASGARPAEFARDASMIAGPRLPDADFLHSIILHE